MRGAVLQTMLSSLIPEIVSFLSQAVALLYRLQFYGHVSLLVPEIVSFLSQAVALLYAVRGPVLRTMSSLLIPEIFSQAVALSCSTNDVVFAHTGSIFSGCGAAVRGPVLRPAAESGESIMKIRVLP